MNILPDTYSNKEPIEKVISFDELIEYGPCSRDDEYQDKNTLKNNNTIFGLELEVENILYGPNLDFYWTTHEDGSLRNNGVEFTSLPLRGRQIVPALYFLKYKLLAENKPVFSGRCSTHIHINVRDLSWQNIYCFVLLYAIFEKHFFNVAGTKREENIFCVPLYKSTQLYNINELQQYLNQWSKYNAINLGSIIGSDHSPRFGTIEFRHLYGTLDIDTIVSWINSIDKLKQACVKEKLTSLVDRILTMNSTSEYLQLYRKIFQEEAKITMMSKLDFESCITNTKLALLCTTIDFAGYKLDSYYNRVKNAGNEIHPKPTTLKFKNFDWSEIPNTQVIDDYISQFSA